MVEISDDKTLAAQQTEPARSPKTHKKGSASVLVAALSGLSMALGWENHKEESTFSIDAPDDQDWLDLDVGPLDQLRHTDEN